MSNRPVFYALLHVADVVDLGINMRSTGDPLNVFLRCAALSARSFAAHDVTWHLVTNRPDRLAARAAALGLSKLSILAHDFRWRVPEGINFRSAHYKLELIEAFGTGAFGEKIGLVDLDTVLLKPFPNAMLSARGLVGYDITATEIADYGAAVIASTVSRIAGRRVPPRWWGGEFLFGSPEDFAQLSAGVASVWPTYLTEWPRLHHQGDEAVLAGAAALLGEDGWSPVDAGRFGAVHRWWSARTRSPHKSLSTALQASLLHLPADKDFLAAYSVDHADMTTFVPSLRRHVRRKRFSRRLLSAFERLFGRSQRYSPRL